MHRRILHLEIELPTFSLGNTYIDDSAMDAFTVAPMENKMVTRSYSETLIIFSSLPIFVFIQKLKKYLPHKWDDQKLN